MKEFIKLPVKILQDLVGDSALLQLYIYLCLRADENGEVETSLSQIQRDLDLPQRPVRTLLDKLRATSKTTSKTTNKSTKLTLYGVMSSGRSATSKTTSKTTNKSTKQNAPKKMPPTREEVQAYIEENNLHWGSADLFVDYYEQKGWRLTDGNLMKDWKAAARNWENRWKEKQRQGKLKSQNIITDGNRFENRRGTDVGDCTERNYSGPF